MKCPVDDSELLMTERQGVEIDYCPKCRGVWLDRGELDKILDRSRAEDAPAPAAPATAPPPAAAPVYPPQDPRYRDPKYDPRYQDQRYYEKKRKKSFFEELFD